MRVIVCITFLFSVFSAPAFADEDTSVWFENYEIISYSGLRALIDANKIDEARVLHDGWWVTVHTKDGKYYDTRITPETQIADLLVIAGVNVEFYHDTDSDNDTPEWKSMIGNFLPLAIFLVFFFIVLGLLNRINKRVHNENMERIHSANEAFLSRQQEQFAKFIEALAELINKKQENG